MSLLERDQELALLDEWHRRASTGLGGVALVRGEAGAGKTTLLRAFETRLRSAARILWAACDPLSTPRPLGPVRDLSAELGGLASVLVDASAPHEICAAVFEHLRTTPTVLVIDDLHWADQGTIDLLRYLLRRMRVTRSLVVCAMRDDEIGAAHALRSFLGDVARSPDAVAATLRPLSVDAVAELAGARDVDVASLHLRTGGNPFFVHEMLAHEVASLPNTVRDAVLARSAHLSRDAWELLQLLVCSPGALDESVIAAVGVTLDALEALARTGLVNREARGVAFRHDLFRSAISAMLPPGGEVAVHRRLLDALDDSAGIDPALLTHHAIGARDARRAGVHAFAAGRLATRSGAHAQAARFFEIALEHGAGDLSEAELLEALAHEYYLLDRLTDAIRVTRRAMDLRASACDPLGVSGNHQALATFHWYNADRELADRHAQLAVDAATVEADTDGSALDRSTSAVAIAAFLALQRSRLDEVKALVQMAEATAPDASASPGHLQLQIVDALRAVHEYEPGGRARVLSLLEAANDHIDEITSSGYSNLSYVDVEQRRLRAAEDLLRFTLPITVERDLPICRVWQRGSRARLRLLDGRWDEALADADAVLVTGSAPVAQTWPLLVRGLVALRRSGEGAADLERAWTLASRYDEPLRVLPAAAALAERAWVTGEDDPRVEEWRARLHADCGAGLEWARGDLAVWLHRLDPERSGAMPSGIAEPHALLLTSEEGAAAAAAAIFHATGSAYDEAMALVDAGTDDRVRRGLDVLDRLGADAIASRLRQELRRTHRAPVPARRRAAARTNPAGLTGRQLEILRLVTAGATNGEIAERLFLARKTVDHHVSAVLAKLHVSSRREVAGRARELGIAPAEEPTDPAR